ncbi:acyl carrier protein [Alicyclobacillus fodiniaquatilis]|jgi:acyl carrier protein|uniref:Acyl carrier protein n=1 Tax=Alicyclobacillus fodiniaquatilis TaxID=1661150 RepID=A0ABW4JDI3_9BACL
MEEIVKQLQEMFKEMGYAQEIDPKRSLTAQLGLDSISLIETVVMIEQKFKLEFDELQLDLAAMDNISNLAKLILEHSETQERV